MEDKAGTTQKDAQRLRLGLLLWLGGMCGAIAATWTLLPALLGEAPVPLPRWVIYLASITQSGLWLALAAWAGVALAPKMGLEAPAFEALAAKRSPALALQPQLVPGLVAGLLGGAFLPVVWRLAPAALLDSRARLELPLFARVLYGGITEEVMMRWGLMSALLWLSWTVLQRRRGVPRGACVGLAIAVSALAFGAGHLPVVAAVLEVLPSDVVVFVIAANTALGSLFGYLFWRFGLESAMLAHIVVHVVSELAGGQNLNR